VIWRCRSGVNEIFPLRLCYGAQIGSYPLFRTNLRSRLPGIQRFKKNTVTLRMKIFWLLELWVLQFYLTCYRYIYTGFYSDQGKKSTRKLGRAIPYILVDRQISAHVRNRVQLPDTSPLNSWQLLYFNAGAHKDENHCWLEVWTPLLNFSGNEFLQNKHRQETRRNSSLYFTKLLNDVGNEDPNWRINLRPLSTLRN
jgi:hypothetical protein